MTKMCARCVRVIHEKLQLRHLKTDLSKQIGIYYTHDNARTPRKIETARYEVQAYTVTSNVYVCKCRKMYADLILDENESRLRHTRVY